MIAPTRPPRTIVAGSLAHRLIRGVLGIRADDRHIERIDLVQMEGWTASIVDSGDVVTWNPDGDTTLHMLWQMDETDAAVNVGDQRFPIAPGDTMSVPGGALLRLTPGMLFVRINAASRTLNGPIAPSHGIESFEGHNRRTDYDSPGQFSLQRWKITQPLTFPVPEQPFVIIGLAEPLAIAWSGGTDLISRGECRVVDPATGEITLLPDGLGYALVIA